MSDFVHNTFSDQNTKGITIYPGSNFDFFSKRSRDEPQGDYVGMVYRLEPDKLNLRSIDVFIQVVQARPNTQILIVGGGTFLGVYKEKVRLAGVESNFRFTGYVHYKQLPDLYRQMAIFVAPVWKESFGQVTPFAMNMGIPVVGYNVGALPEIIGCESMSAPPGDAGRLKDIIVELLESPDKQTSIALANQMRARELFSLEAMVTKYRKLYGELLTAK